MMIHNNRTNEYNLIANSQIDKNVEKEFADSEDEDTSTISSTAPSTMSAPTSTIYETINATGEKQLNYRTKSGFSIRI